VQVDVDELGGLAAELGISSMPTFLFYKGGDIIHTMRGADEAKLREKVAELILA
jgi:thioredoxin 1